MVCMDCHRDRRMDRCMDHHTQEACMDQSKDQCRDHHTQEERNKDQNMDQCSIHCMGWNTEENKVLHKDQHRDHNT